jgi:hypothetical protein
MKPTVEKLPSSVLCCGCDLKHFLSINRDTYGRWSAGYIAYDDDEGESVIPELCLNNADSLDEVALRMEQKLKHWRQRQGKPWTS